MKKQNLILLALVIAIIVTGILIAISQELPSGFWGNANLNGNPAIAGRVVSAWIGSVQCGSYTIETAGNYGLVVPPDSTSPGCGTEGATVLFKIGGSTATPTGTWHSGSNQYLDINAGTPPAGCSIGAACTSCTDWVAATKPHGAPGSCTGNGCVRNSTSSGIYDQACCGGTVSNIITY